MGRRILLAGLVAAGCAGTDDTDAGRSTLGVGGNSSSGASASGDDTLVPATTATSATATSTTAPPDSATETTGATTGADASTGGSLDTGTTGTPASWNRYTLDVSRGTWAQIGLDELWTTANAPPATGISAAVSLTHFDRLYVVTDDGMFYEESDGAWISPVPLSERYPMAAGADLAAMVHTPGQTPGDTTEEDIFLIDTPEAIIYIQQENGGVDFQSTTMLQDARGAAPQASVRVRWYFAITDPSGIGSDGDWLQWFAGYENGEFWKFNAAFEWTQWPIDDNPFFTGAAGEPNPETIRAAYHDDAFGRVHFIGP